jgi:hypothetical protein
MEDSVEIGNRGDFGLWAIEAAKQIVSEQGFELAKAARDGTEDDVRTAANALGQAITNALMEVFDGLLEEPAEAETLEKASPPTEVPAKRHRPPVGEGFPNGSYLPI